MSFYQILLFLHSWLRWAILLTALWVLIRSFRGWQMGLPFKKSDNGMQAAFVGMMHLQLVLGLLLYFVFSPFGLDAFAQGAKVVMKNAGLRYWAVEHATVMLLAVILAQVGRTKSKRARAHKQKFKHAFVFFLISLILMLSRIPWHESARLFRSF
ncbi:MAG: hypothetical protein KatS3mg033_1235 [Thermonema sp.]|jgi:uncharacterized membrane protein YozB (DUF420 family)|uniref:hypothetical protein n=1 Tax=Thermonema TaxID=28194 RepID=UPI00056F7077|nr:MULTISPECIES: hypothetical protein [Thermonema]GIV39435.1 MAG: hypothetical protein KatS3mg033_1235 [Thermonema sp.]